MSFDPITAGLDILGKIIDRVIPDRTAADKAKAELITMQTQGELNQLMGQLEINKTEAASSNWFVAGWRPCSGWICNIGLLYTFLLQPFLAWLSTIVSIPIPPAIDTQTLMVLLGSLLGVGTLRTVDKIKGVAS
jgi:hypothetical protein